MRHVALLSLVLGSLVPGPLAAGSPRPRPPPPPHDVVVYGGTSAGVVAAVQVARMGKSVVLVVPERRVGGLSSGGLGATDIGNKEAIGGLSRSFYERVGEHYARPDAWRFQKREAYRSRRQRRGEKAMWTFEPRVAEKIFEDMLREANVPLLRRERLDLTGGVHKEGGRIVRLKMESGREVHGRIFIDATYEGDLLALAGVSYHVGRESNATYRETLNGVQTRHAVHHQFLKPVDPYVVPGDPSSGLLPGVHGDPPGREGSGDSRVQAYNFRMCLTDAAENRLPISRPGSYAPLRYEILLRYFDAGFDRVPWNLTPMPNRKTDINNNHGFSTDNIGRNYDYPDGDHATRERIREEHKQYHLGLLWCLGNERRVPEPVRREVSRWGLCKDEFVDTGHWQEQLYVREARRMIGEYVMTQRNCQMSEIAPKPVGLAAYTMDSHNVQRYVRNGRTLNEGDVQVGGFPPYPVGYGSLCPRRRECTNLLVPVCLSASHIAYGSIRMEPVFMVLGQSAATAACHAVDAGVAVQDVDPARLRARLLRDGQRLVWKSSPAPRPGAVRKAALRGVVVDDKQARLVGAWQPSAAAIPYVDAGYLHDGNDKSSRKTATFVPRLPRPGRYEVLVCFSPHANRARSVPVVVRSASGAMKLTVDQRSGPTAGKPFQSLGVYRFTEEAAVIISNEGTDGYVVVDAVQFLPIE